MTALLIVLGVFFAIKQLWLYYTAAMRLKMVRAELRKGQRVLGYVLLCEGLLLDLIFHFTIATVLFAEWPARGEWTLSARLWRLSNSAPSWRQRLALYIRTKLLDNVDPAGIHHG